MQRRTSAFFSFLFSGRKPEGRIHARQTVRPSLEALESRDLLSSAATLAPLLQALPKPSFGVAALTASTSHDLSVVGQGASVAGQGATTRTVYVSNTAQFRLAVSHATPGTHILLRAGVYSGDNYFAGVNGTAAASIVIAGADASHPPVIQGGFEGLKFSNVSYLRLENLIIQGAAANGVNIDDGGHASTPSHDLVLSGLTVRNIGSSGDGEGIKFAGVQNFTIDRCTLLNWGGWGEGIDMVGCHNGVIQNSHLQNGDVRGAVGVQAKGGSTDIDVRNNVFLHAGARAVQIGGDTAQHFFRPQPAATYEASRITVEGNVIVGSEAAIAFTGANGSVVKFNTIYEPTTWVIRILQEDRVRGMVPSENGVFSDNIVVFKAGQLQTAVNIGSGTAPGTFHFLRNWWYALDAPSLSRPSLPSPETGGTYGVDPQFVNAAARDFHLKASSHARNVGAYAPRP